MNAFDVAILALVFSIFALGVVLWFELRNPVADDGLPTIDPAKLGGCGFGGDCHGDKNCRDKQCQGRGQ